MKNVLTILSLILSVLLNVTVSNGQVLTTDVSLGVIVGLNGAEERSLWKKVHREQKSITAAQTATTAVVDKLKQIQNKIYTGLTTVNSALKDGYSVYYIGILIKDIVEWEGKMIAEAAHHPMAAAWAAKIQKQLVEKSTSCLTDMSQFILKANDNKLLMRAGERAQLLFNIKQELKVMRTLAVSSYYTIHWVAMQGIINSINPFQGYVNIDKRLAQEVLHTWKF